MTALLKVDLLTLFPDMPGGFLSESIIGKANASGILDIQVHNIRDWATDKHQITDSRPFGGGAGMVLRPEPLFKAVEALRSESSRVLYLAPDGERLTVGLAKKLAENSHLILISGHYEGIDQRVRDYLVDGEISIGDYVLTNGTLAGAVLVDVISRYVPGVLGEQQSLHQDSFYHGLLGIPQYTRPADFRGMTVPDVLLSGNHGAIREWRTHNQQEKTRNLRPDLISQRSDQS